MTQNFFIQSQWELTLHSLSQYFLLSKSLRKKFKWSKLKRSFSFSNPCIALWIKSLLKFNIFLMKFQICFTSECNVRYIPSLRLWDSAWLCLHFRFHKLFRVFFFKKLLKSSFFSAAMMLYVLMMMREY